MPLLNKQPFVRSKPPPDLQPNEEVFFCEPTKEIFRDYDKFFERMILCNSLLWSCELTGKADLTYLEAAESEKAAKRFISSIQKEFKRALLLLCTFTRKTNFSELCVDLFILVKDRFFKGEHVQVKRGSQWQECEVKTICVSGLPTAGAPPTHNGDEQQRVPASRLKSEGVTTGHVVYQVHETNTGRLLAVRHQELRRDKNAFSKDRLRVLLRHCTRQEECGYLTVRAPVARALGIDTLKWQDVFVGPAPVFVPSKPLPVKAKAEKAKSEPAQKVKVEGEKKVKPDSRRQLAFDAKDDEPLSAVQCEIRQRWEAERRALAEQRSLERDQRRLRKKQVHEWIKEWSKPREDLTCEDHKELPIMMPVHTRIPGPLFGGCLQLLEFFVSFSVLLDAADTFPHGLNLLTLERALCDTEVDGPLSDLLQVLLRALVELQKEEDEEAGVTSSCSSVAHLDALTLTETLRKHLAARDSAQFDARWRYQQRGGYTDMDNPTVQFCMDHPDIMDKLATESVHDLSPGERLAILECLVGEILTTAIARDIIDEAEAKLKEARAELRTVRLTAQAFQRGVQAERITERREDRQRQQMELQQQHQQQQQESQHVTDPSAGDATATENPLEPPVLLPEIDETERQRRHQEAEKALAEFARKETRLQRQVWELSQQFGVAPIGRDRAYRRYWLGRALPGLFVEHEDAEVGPCLETATPHHLQLSQAGDDKSAVLRQLLTERLMEMRKGGETAGKDAAVPAPGQASPGDKENTPKPPPPTNTYAKKATALTEKNQDSHATGALQNGDATTEDSKRRLDALVTSADLDLTSVLRAIPETGSTAPDRRLLVCTGEGDECPVHSTILPRTCWAFVPDMQHLEQLMATLNERGLRELELKQALVQAGDSVRSCVERCPVDILAHHEGRRSRRDATSGGRDPNLNFPPGTPVAQIQELLLRDMILECEEKIRLGYLGTVQVLDLFEWRQALVDRSYDKQCYRLMWGVDGAYSADTSATMSRASTPVGGDSAEDGDQQSSAAGAELSARAQRRLLVRSLASAILQLAQGVDSKYLKAPLGDSETLHSWEASLMGSTSLSQLFVHFAQLEAAVQWSKSALNARCKVCRKKSDPEKMLLCDECDKGYHIYCLKPKIRSIPKGDWFCSTCRPKEKPKSPKKKRRAFTLEEEEEVEEKPEEQQAEEEDEEVEDVPVKRTSRGGKKGGAGSGTKKGGGTRRKVDLSPPSNITAGTKRRSAPENDTAAGDGQLDRDLLSTLLSELRAHQCSQMFLKPVQKKQAPDYYRIVREPMDLGSMLKKLPTYRSNAEFVHDAGLVFSNCCMYNDSRSTIYKNCEKLRRFFEKRSRELGIAIGTSGKRARRSN